MNELLSFAKKMLAEHAGFHPFGGYLDTSAHVVHVGVQPDVRQMTAEQKVKVLNDSFKKLAVQRHAIAFAVTTDITLPYEDGSKGDAIKFFLEHNAGYCAEVFFRYQRGTDGTVEITDITAQQGGPIFFKSTN